MTFVGGSTDNFGIVLCIFYLLCPWYNKDACWISSLENVFLIYECLPQRQFNELFALWMCLVVNGVSGTVYVLSLCRCAWRGTCRFCLHEIFVCRPNLAGFFSFYRIWNRILSGSIGRQRFSVRALHVYCKAVYVMPD
jgi:hypothetical protein